MLRHDRCTQLRRDGYEWIGDLHAPSQLHGKILSADILQE